MTELFDVPASLDSLLGKISTKFDQAEAADIIHEVKRLYPNRKDSFDQNDLCGALKQLYVLGAIDDDGDQKLLEILAGKTSKRSEIVKLLSGYKEACSPSKDDFVGRDADVDNILKLVTDPGVPGVNLFGDSGVGKTTLAKEVAKRLESFDTVFIDLREIKSLDTLYFYILQALHLPVWGDNKRERIYKHLETLSRKTVLILDSIEQVISRESQAEQETKADFLEFLKVIINTEASKIGRLNVILTSTTKLIESESEGKFFPEQSVQSFSEDVSKDFISKRVRGKVSDHQEDEVMCEIAFRCRNNPYLLQGAEQLMRENFASPTDVLRKITAQIEKGVPERFASISALFDSLPNDHLKQVALKISLLRRPFSVSIAMKIAEISSGYDAELDLEMLAMHKIITADWVEEKKPNESRRKRKYDLHALFKDFVTSHLCKENPDYKEQLKKAEQQFFEHFSGKLTKLANNLESEFVKTYSKLEINRANFELAIELSEENKETLDLLLHTDDHNQFALMGILFEVLKDENERRELFGKWAEAAEEQEQWFTSALMRCWQSIQGSYLEGTVNEEILEKAKTSIKKLQSSSPEKSNEVNCLFLHCQGKIKWMKAKRLTPEQRTRKHGKKLLEEGIKHFKQSIEMRKQLNGDSTLAARALNLIGNCYMELEDPSEAKKHYQQAMDMKIRLVGNENHWEIPTYYNQMAQVYEMLGREEEEKWYNHVFGSKEKARKEYGKAVEWTKRALALQDELGVSNTIHTAIFQRNLANILIGLGEYDQALDYAKKSFEIRNANLGKHPETVRILYLIGTIHEHKENPEAALRSYEEASVMEEYLPEDNHSVVRKLLCNRLKAMRRKVKIKEKLEEYKSRITKIRKKLFTDRFQVTPRGCVVRSSVCGDVTIEFPEGAVDKTVEGTLKLLLVPEDASSLHPGILPCPVLFVHGLKEYTFKKPVTVRVPHPRPEEYSAQDKPVLFCYKVDQWEDVTNDIELTLHESFIEFKVQHFCRFWVLLITATAFVTGVMVGKMYHNLDAHIVTNPLLFSSEREEEDDEEIQDLVSHFGNASLATLSAEEVAETLPLYLGVDRTVIQDPPYKIMQKCQQFCRFLKNNGRRDIVEALRDELPSGMTGPLLDGNILVKDLDHAAKLRLSRALSVKDEWQIFAEKIDGITNIDIQYYSARKDNPVLEILKDYCNNMKIDTLYRLLVESGANAYADFL